MNWNRVLATLLALAALAASPACAAASTPKFGNPTTVAEGVEAPMIAARGGAGRIAWLSNASGQEQSVVSASLPPDGTISPPETLATADSNGIGQPSTSLEPPRVAVATAGSSAVLWGEVTSGGPAGTDALTFGVSAIARGLPASPPARPAGRATQATLVVDDGDKTVRAIWKDSRGGLSVANVEPDGSLTDTKEIVPPPKHGSITPLGVSSIVFDDYLIWTDARGEDAPGSVFAAELGLRKPAPIQTLARTDAKHRYSSFAIAGERVFAFERSRGASYLVSAFPKKSGSVTHLARTPGDDLPFGLQAAGDDRHRSDAVLAWSTTGNDVFEAVPTSLRKATIRSLTPGPLDGRGPDVAIDQGGLGTVVWRDGANGRRDQILAVQVNRRGKPSSVAKVSHGARGLTPQVAIGADNRPLVIWNSNGGRLELARGRA